MNASSNTADDEDDPIIKASKRTETRAEKKPKLEKKRADRLRAKHPHLKDVPERLSAAQQKRFLFQHGLLPKVEQEKMTKMVKAEERRERKHARNAPRRMAKGKAPMGPGSAAAAAAAVAAVAAAVGKPSKRARRQRSRSANLTGPGREYILRSRTINARADNTLTPTVPQQPLPLSFQLPFRPSSRPVSQSGGVGPAQ